jgi:hypothetical protein
MRKALYASVVLLAASACATAQIGYVDFDGTETGLIGYSNPTYTWTGSGTDALNVSSNGTGVSSWSPGDSFWPMTRADIGPNTIGMPFAISDDSVAPAAGNSVFAGDTQGFIGITYENNGFFGVCDTQNSMNSGPISADFMFDITGETDLGLKVDLAAMGDFEAADVFTFEVDIDGGGFVPIITNFVDEAGFGQYQMDNLANNPVFVDDPLYMNGVKMHDFFKTVLSPIAGTGATLTVRFTATADGGSEGFAFDNLRVVPEPATLTLLAFGGLALLRRRR